MPQDPAAARASAPAPPARDCGQPGRRAHYKAGIRRRTGDVALLELVAPDMSVVRHGFGVLGADACREREQRRRHGDGSLPRPAPAPKPARSSRTTAHAGRARERVEACAHSHVGTQACALACAHAPTHLLLSRIAFHREVHVKKTKKQRLLCSWTILLV